MALIHLNADTGSGRGAQRTLARALNATPKCSAPIIVMIHGYKYDPACPERSPHALIFGQNHPHSWPGGLGLTRGSPTLGVAFGWAARGKLRAAFGNATRAGTELAALIALAHRMAPNRPLHLMAHSLGAEVAFAALTHAPAGSVARVIVMAAASFQARALRALASPTGRSAELINVISGQNALFDRVFEWVIPAPEAGDRALGRGLAAPNALTLRLDCPATRAALAGLHLCIARPAYPVCHWSGYTTPGALAVYADLMHRHRALSLGRIRCALAQQAASMAPPLGKRTHRWLSGAKAPEHLPYEPAN